MKITSQLNYLRIAPRKVRAVADLLRGQDVDEARSQLRYLARRPAGPLEKLLKSAVANARNNQGLDQRYLYIREITVDEGMKLKRFKPKGFGRVMPIQKKTSRIKIVLDELPEDRKKEKDALLAKRPAFEETGKKEKAARGKIRDEKAKVEAKGLTAAEKEVVKGGKKGAFGGIKTLGRKLFRRKSI